MSEDIVLQIACGSYDDNQWENLLPDLLNYLNNNFLRGYHPLLRLTCQRWNISLLGQKHKSLSIFELAKQGHLVLLQLIIDSKWHSPKSSLELTTSQFLPVLGMDLTNSPRESEVFVRKKTLTTPAILEMLLGGAAGGHVDVCSFAISRGANDFASMLIEAAGAGQEHICHLAKEWITHDKPALSDLSTVPTTGLSAIMVSLQDMIFSASLNGHRQICQLARDWGSTRFDGMIEGAIIGGHLGICELARQWMIELGTPCNYDRILAKAASNGHSHLCHLIKSWGAIDYISMLREAVETGHENICRLAKKWLDEDGRSGLINCDGVLTTAAVCGRANICRLAKEWGATDLEGMLRFGASSKHEEVCKLAKEWGATDFDDMLLSGAMGGWENICRSAKEWGATNFNEMLFCGAQRGDENICKLAKEWGADNFSEMLRFAYRYNKKKTIELAIKWVREIES